MICPKCGRRRHLTVRRIVPKNGRVTIMMELCSDCHRELREFLLLKIAEAVERFCADCEGE